MKRNLPLLLPLPLLAGCGGSPTPTTPAPAPPTPAPEPTPAPAPPPPPKPEPEPPATPIGLHISALGNDFVEWSWNPVPGADFYEVQTRHPRSDGSPPIFLDTDSTTPVTKPFYRRRHELSRYSEYFLRVRSVSRTTGESAWSSSSEPGKIDSDPLLWRELVFDASDCPTGSDPDCQLPSQGTCVDRRKVRAHDRVPRFNIVQHVDDASFSLGNMDEIEDSIRGGIRALLSKTPTVTRTSTDRKGGEVINIVPFPRTYGEGDPIGYAPGIGVWEGNMGIAVCPACDVGPVAQHELGHVMGFFHVDDVYHLMFFSKAYTTDVFTEKELSFMKCAIELGRDAPYTPTPPCALEN